MYVYRKIYSYLQTNLTDLKMKYFLTYILYANIIYIYIYIY